jgi:hypothetical protein
VAFVAALEADLALSRVILSAIITFKRGMLPVVDIFVGVYGWWKAVRFAASV